MPDCPAREIDQQSGHQRDAITVRRNGKAGKFFGSSHAKITASGEDSGYGGSGGASRYYAQPEWQPGDYLASIYTPKAGKRERNAGLDDSNHHPTVKPVALMRYLIRLVTPPGGTVLDPFLGSGTTAVAAILEGFDWIGCELTAEYLPIIEARCQWARENIEIPEPTLFDGDTA
jgi:site-specific DNA-methyltransferase (adenine-specific)